VDPAVGRWALTDFLSNGHLFFFLLFIIVVIIIRQPSLFPDCWKLVTIAKDVGSLLFSRSILLGEAFGLINVQ
jgi:hypothetical protein